MVRKKNVVAKCSAEGPTPRSTERATLPTPKRPAHPETSTSQTNEAEPVKMLEKAKQPKDETNATVQEASPSSPCALQVGPFPGFHYQDSLRYFQNSPGSEVHLESSVTHMDMNHHAFNVMKAQTLLYSM